MPIPNADNLISSYPFGTSDEVKKRIGGGVNAGWITNTCAIRLSRSFNYSGGTIPAGPANSVAGMHTVRGGDKLHYAYRVAEFRTWLTSKYGQPTVSLKNGPYGTAPQQLAGKKGIICFVDCGWSDASGHLDLWDGEKVVNHGYFELAKQVYLWESRPTASGGGAKVGKATSNVNVRSGPGTSFQVVGTLKAGTTVQVLESRSGWCRIGDAQWVSASYIKVGG